MAYWSDIRSLEMTSHHGLKLVARVDRATLEEPDEAERVGSVVGREPPRLGSTRITLGGISTGRIERRTTAAAVRCLWKVLLLISLM
jgi:hypothetical protein